MSTIDQMGPTASGGQDVRELLNRIPVAVSLLDEDRRVVFGEDRLLDLVGARAPARDDSHAPGDLLGCVNARAARHGCGTHAACELCGAYRAITESQRSGKAVTRECRIRYESDSAGGDLDLTVTATPYHSDGQVYTLLTVQDASDEKRRRALERVFFHDITNIAGGLAGLASVLRHASSPDEADEMLTMMERSARSLLDEIEAQRQLASAEAGELTVSAQATNSLSIMREVADTLRYHRVAEGRSLVVAPGAVDVDWEVDPVLLRRVLVNLCMNALEASPPGATVTLDAEQEGESIAFTVHNQGVMPMDVQRQLFQRSFSTKGAGRGLGSYSVRMITEDYLGGHVTFTSTETGGTLFRIIIPTTPG